MISGDKIGKVKIPKLKKEFEVAGSPSLMHELLANGMPVASSCAGDGVCGKCRVSVLSGQENLAEPEALEIELSKKFALAENERISCQTNCLGGVVELTTGYW
jgi:ferredoxin, 2Fe-2S